MATTIQISEELRDELKKRKFHTNETYEDVIWDLLEDLMELSEETKIAIKEAENHIKLGKTISLSDLKKEIDN